MCHMFSDVEWRRVNVSHFLCFRMAGGLCVMCSLYWNGGGFMCHVISVLEWWRVYVPCVLCFSLAAGLCAT